MRPASEQTSRAVHVHVAQGTAAEAKTSPRKRSQTDADFQMVDYDPTVLIFACVAFMIGYAVYGWFTQRNADGRTPYPHTPIVARHFQLYAGTTVLVFFVLQLVPRMLAERRLAMSAGFKSPHVRLDATGLDKFVMTVRCSDSDPWASAWLSNVTAGGSEDLGCQKRIVSGGSTGATFLYMIMHSVIRLNAKTAATIVPLQILSLTIALVSSGLFRDGETEAAVRTILLSTVAGCCAIYLSHVRRNVAFKRWLVSLEIEKGRDSQKSVCTYYIS